MQRAQNSLSASTFSRGQPLSSDVDGNNFLQNRASSDTSKVERNSAVSRKPSHVAFFLVRRRLPGIHTSEWRVHWPLNPQIQEGTQRRRWSTHCRLRTNVEQLCAIIVRINEMFKEANYVKTNDQQWYRVVPDACDVRKTRTQYMSVSGQRIPMP